MVRPILEYSSSVWSPFLVKDIVRLEQVQRRATKLIPSISHLTYTDRLTKLGIPTLQYRRDRQDLIHVYNLINSDQCESFFSLDTDNRLRGNGLKIKKTEHYNKTIKQKFFSQRVINIWNSLPYSVVHSQSLNCFKSALNVLNWHENKFSSD